MLMHFLVCCEPCGDRSLLSDDDVVSTAEVLAFAAVHGQHRGWSVKMVESVAHPAGSGSPEHTDNRAVDRVFYAGMFRAASDLIVRDPSLAGLDMAEIAALSASLNR